MVPCTARESGCVVTAECTTCGADSGDLRCGYCVPCYHRWRRAGYPAAGPPPAPLQGDALTEEYRWLREAGESHAIACDHLKVRTAACRSRLRKAHEGDAAPTWRPKRQEYLNLRAEGLGRKAAAAAVGSSVTTTYNWEPPERPTARSRPRGAMGQRQAVAS